MGHVASSCAWCCTHASRSFLFLSCRSGQERPRRERCSDVMLTTLATRTAVQEQKRFPAGMIAGADASSANYHQAGTGIPALQLCDHKTCRVCSHQVEMGFHLTKRFLFNHTTPFSTKGLKSHCVISQEPFLYGVRTLSSAVIWCLVLLKFGFFRPVSHCVCHTLHLCACTTPGPNPRLTSDDVALIDPHKDTQTFLRA